MAICTQCKSKFHGLSDTCVKCQVDKELKEEFRVGIQVAKGDRL
jgi:hypothetical protein